MIECVPNFSEGRDRAKVAAIADAISSVEGVVLLGWELDADHNRSVITFAGAPDAVLEAALRGVGKAAELIDLNQHQGVHPRVGAADVVPFIPLQGSSMEECVRIAHEAGERVWHRFGIPIYFYEAAARRPGRKALQNVRRTGFDGLPPDYGGTGSHPTAGAACVGARRFLIAYNVDLVAQDIAIAKAIAKTIRESSGGFAHVKAIGLFLESQQRAQVSMNLTDFTQIPLDELYSAIEQEASRLGTSIDSSELIGFIPQAAFEQAPAFFRRIRGFDQSRVIESRIRQLLDSK